MSLNLSKSARNHTLSFCKSTIAAIVFSGCFVSIVQAASPSDPFAQDTWHAVDKTWPGTIKFNGKEKTVKLEPMGSAAINAKYTFTVDTPTAKEKNPKERRGTLRMVNEAGQVSESSFLIIDKTLTLTFKTGQGEERYLRMSPAEEQAERARIQQMVKDGKAPQISPPKLPVAVP